MVSARKWKSPPPIGGTLADNTAWLEAEIEASLLRMMSARARPLRYNKRDLRRISRNIRRLLADAAKLL
jgi:hypothetical protein